MQINLERQHLIILVFSIAIVAGIGLVVGYGGTNPSNLGHTMSEIEGINDLSGFCIFSSTQKNCPSGWTRATAFDNRTIRAVNPALEPLIVDGPTAYGGADTHAHTVWEDPSSLADGSPNKVHVWRTYVINPASSWPLYANVIVCCKD